METEELSAESCVGAALEAWRVVMVFRVISGVDSMLISMASWRLCLGKADCMMLMVLVMSSGSCWNLVVSEGCPFNDEVVGTATLVMIGCFLVANSDWEDARGTEGMAVL